MVIKYQFMIRKMNNQACDKKIKHLEMIEAIIERMGSNSFKLKGWTVTLVSIIGALSVQGTDKRFFLLPFIPLIVFWVLDSYYLQLERKYRVLYRNVSELSEDDIDFNMNTKKIICNEQEASKICFCNCLFSWTEFPFYIVLAATVIILAVFFIISK